MYGFVTIREWILISQQSRRVKKKGKKSRALDEDGDKNKRVLREDNEQKKSRNPTQYRHQQTSAQQPTGADRAAAAAASREPKEEPVPTREPPSRRGSQIEQLHNLGAADQRTQQSPLPQSRVAATTRLEKNRKQQHSVADRRKTNLFLRSSSRSSEKKKNCRN
ncbi:hypothetical protein HAX54_004933 [Datura stramonium]|uniref:Uncharacterized protein n=1 Tax=Datura stramonium TaxID=4076 RepID=A0ABS8T931_DATST|nr:hypothetical protein [Datura stramonium]